MRISFKRLILAITAFAALPAAAHPMVQAGLDVVISRDKVTIDARIAIEEVLVAASHGTAFPPKDAWPALVRDHGSYVLSHLRLKADGTPLEGKVTSPGEPIGDLRESGSAHYRLEYPLAAAPSEFRMNQRLLRDIDTWTVTCAIRVRQEGSPFDMATLPPEKDIAYDCQWPAATTATTAPASSAAPESTSINLASTLWSYLKEGIHHILTGYDHLLFVSALVIATTSFWDLVKVVTAFTIAHTATLTLSVLNIVHVAPRVSEPMIAASIIFVAIQNVISPERSRGKVRLAIAFGFGLFHGLGYAGGLIEAMGNMPAAALWAALIAFSVGVEVGHQIVVIPLFTALTLARHAGTDHPRTVPMAHFVRIASVAIALGGVWFLVFALRQWHA